MVEYHFFSDPGPRNDQRRAGNLLANKDTRVEHRHEDNSSLDLSWVAHFVHELLDFVDELQCGESCENIPLEFHRLSVNYVQSSVLW